MKVKIELNENNLKIIFPDHDMHRSLKISDDVLNEIKEKLNTSFLFHKCKQEQAQKMKIIEAINRQNQQTINKTLIAIKS